MFNVRLAGATPVWEVTVHLAVACDVYDGVFVLSFYPRDVLDETLNLIESVSEGFPIYSINDIDMQGLGL